MTPYFSETSVQNKKKISPRLIYLTELFLFIGLSYGLRSLFEERTAGLAIPDLGRVALRVLLFLVIVAAAVVVHSALFVWLRRRGILEEEKDAS